MKKLLKISLILFVTFMISCDLYPDWKSYVTYSEIYPICGEYIVNEYSVGTDTLIEDETDFSLYIYNKSYNPSKDSIWIDNNTGHGDSYLFKYKIKCKADTVNLTFNCENAGNVTGYNVNPLANADKVTIVDSKIFDLSEDIEDPTPDSIYFRYTMYDSLGVEKTSRIIKGHRKTGWENPNYNDPMP